MNRYVCGFMFNEGRTKVALIRKNRPKWQKNKLNGIGGKIELGEIPIDAMVREFREESGIDTGTGMWDEFCILSGAGWSVNMYRSIGNIYKLRTVEDEEIELHNVNAVMRAGAVPNLNWLIPMALNSNVILARVHEAIPDGELQDG